MGQPVSEVKEVAFRESGIQVLLKNTSPVSPVALQCLDNLSFKAPVY